MFGKKFYKFLRYSHFLEDGESYVYRFDDLSQEETMKLVALFKDMGFIDDVTSSGATPRKQNNLFKETRLLVEATTKKDKHVTLVNNS